MKLLDFLHFDLTNPMVPNLSNEFLSGWVSGTVSRGTHQVKIAIFTDFDIFGHFLNVSGIPQNDPYASKSAGYCLYIMLLGYNITCMLHCIVTLHVACYNCYNLFFMFRLKTFFSRMSIVWLWGFGYWVWHNFCFHIYIELLF